MYSQTAYSATLRLARCLGHRCSIFATTSHENALVYKQKSMDFVQTRKLHVTRIRTIRAKYPDDKQEKQQNEKEKHYSDDKKSNDEQESKKIDTPAFRKLRMYVLAVAGISFVTSFILLSQVFSEDRNIAEGFSSEDLTRPGIPMKTFIEKYLKRGEVKRIVFVPSNTRAIAILHPGAIIDGKPASNHSIIVEYTQNSQQFWADIRREEAEIGIGLSQGVPIDLYQGMTTVKIIELLIGAAIIAWLGTQYGRLLRKRFLENQTKNRKN